MRSQGLHLFTFELLKKHLSIGAEILDLGTGEGDFAKGLSDAGYDVTACDIEPRSGRPFPYVSVDLNSEFSKAFRGRTYDAISFVGVIEQLENPRLCLREIAKLIKRYGVVLVSTPNASAGADLVGSVREHRHLPSKKESQTRIQLATSRH